MPRVVYKTRSSRSSVLASPDTWSTRRALDVVGRELIRRRVRWRLRLSTRKQDRSPLVPSLASHPALQQADERVTSRPPAAPMESTEMEDDRERDHDAGFLEENIEEGYGSSYLYTTLPKRHIRLLHIDHGEREDDLWGRLLLVPQED